MTRPRLIIFGLTINVYCASIATSVFALTSPIPKGSLSIRLATFATIPGADGTPQDLVPIGDGTGRMFVAARNGKIDIVGPNSAAPATFLDMRNVVGGAGLSIQVGTEGGLLGLALSPNYYAPAGTPGSGKFYTFQTESFNLSSPAADFSHPEIFPTTIRNPNNQITIREWSVSGDPNIAQTTSRVLLRINHPADNHQGGGLKFGPDGNLYISLGDGGLSNDGGAAAPLDGHTDSVGNGQDKSVVFGKILRIDPNGTTSANGQYGIPATNPFSNAAGGLQEIYAYGFRNPYRFSFDALNGRLLVGDVGEGAREEIDSVTGGANYGWPFREGTRDNSLSNGSGRATPDGFSYIAPLAEYTHGDGLAVLGGFVYRGTEFPFLSGKYVFGDLGSSSGRLFYMDATGGTINEFNYLGASPSARLLGFGEGNGGQIYALFANGTIVAIVPEPSGLEFLMVAVPAWIVFQRFRPPFINSGRDRCSKNRRIICRPS